MAQNKIPLEVVKAIRFYRQKINDQDALNALFIAIPNAGVFGPATFIKQFAQEHPTDYIQLLANQPKTVEEEVAEMINEWMNKEYVGNEQEDVKQFAEMITNYIQHY